MSYETVTLATVAYSRIQMDQDSALLTSANSTFEVPEKLELKRTLPKQGQSVPVTRGVIRTTHAWKDTVTGQVYQMSIETRSSVPVQIPAATQATALDRHQAAIATEALATDVLTKGVIY